MARDLWLIRFESFDKETDADLVRAHQIEETQPGTIGECFEQSLNAVVFVRHAGVDC